MRYKEFWQAARLLGYSADDFSATFRTLRQSEAVEFRSATGIEIGNPLVQLTSLGKSVAEVVRQGKPS
jgi:hypothetical protein